MGISCSFGVDQAVKDILKIFDDKAEDLLKTLLIEENEAKDDQEKQQNNRHQQLENKKKNNEEIKEEDIKKLNEEELEVEVKLLGQEVNKMHLLFEIGLDLVEPLKKYTLDKLLAKAKNAPALALKKINEEIEEVKNLPNVKFIKSGYGKALMTAMEKKGLSETLLKGFKKELFNKRKDRRKKEREEFNIQVNEFPDETLDKIKLKNIFNLATEEYRDSKKPFKIYIQEKILEKLKEENGDEDEKDK